MKKALFVSLMIASSSFFIAQPAFSGDQTLRKASGEAVHIKCRNSGCFITEFDANGAVENRRQGPGGTPNFKKNVKKYEAKGYR